MVVKTNVLPRVLPSQMDTLMAIEASVYQISSKGFSNMLEYDLLFLIMPALDKKYSWTVKLYEAPYLYKHKKSYKDFINSDLTPTIIEKYKTATEVADFINDKLLSHWTNHDVFKIKVRITPYLATKENISETIYVKQRGFGTGMASAVRHDYKRHNQLKSTRMCHKKSQSKKSPVKRMTGNISGLGKNFNKLI